MEVWSYVYAEQSTGAIWTEGYTEVYNLNAFSEGTDYYAYVQSQLSPTGTFAAAPTNNCGTGCAVDWFEDQVPYLGATLTLYSFHQGWGYDSLEGSFYCSQSSNSTFLIPNAPSLTFTSIDARIPNNVIWGIAVNGGGYPWEINFNMGGFYQITSGQIASTDQAQYVSGSTVAYLSGLDYGIPFNGQSCNVIVDQNHSYTGSNSFGADVGGDGEAPQWIVYSQFGAFTTTNVAYTDNGSGPCAGIVNHQSLTTLLQSVIDTLDTTQNIRSADSEINTFVPQAFYPPLWGAQNLPPAPGDGMGQPQSDWFQSRGINWSGNWVPSPSVQCTGLCAQPVTQVCPTVLTLGVSSGGQPVFLWCWSVFLP
jgi:hypothetical protein